MRWVLAIGVKNHYIQNPLPIQLSPSDPSFSLVLSLSLSLLYFAVSPCPWQREIKERCAFFLDGQHGIFCKSATRSLLIFVRIPTLFPRIADGGSRRVRSRTDKRPPDSGTVGGRCANTVLLSSGGRSFFSVANAFPNNSKAQTPHGRYGGFDIRIHGATMCS